MITLETTDVITTTDSVKNIHILGQPDSDFMLTATRTVITTDTTTNTVVASHDYDQKGRLLSSIATMTVPFNGGTITVQQIAELNAAVSDMLHVADEADVAAQTQT